jgi:Tudor domain
MFACFPWNDSIFLSLSRYRAAYIAPAAETGSHKLFYVDYGITRAVSLNDIYRLTSLSVALREFPGQAFKIRLYEIPTMTPSLLARLRGLLPQNQKALVKILSSSSNIPLVNLFIQSGPQQTLASVNEALRYEKDLENFSDQASDGPVGRPAGKTSPSSLDNNPASR